MNVPVTLINLRKVVVKMTVINFDEARREKQFEKRYNEIDKYVHLGQYELFDEWIAKEEKMLTDKRASECKSYMQFLGEQGCNLSDVLQEVIINEPCDFEYTFGVDWLESIEASLTYYAILRKHKRNHYDITLMAHPFIGIV